MLDQDLLALLHDVTILPRRLSLATPGVAATVPMLRGTWGAALRRLDRGAYDRVFEGLGQGVQRQPLYILRPAPPDPADAPALEWISLGPALADDASLLRAWDVASGQGLGPERQPFTIRARRLLAPDGALLDQDVPTPGWPLSAAAWPLPDEPAATPCCLVFNAPLRLLRDGQLLERPHLADIAAAALRRLRALLAPLRQAALRSLEPALLEAARRRPQEPWAGRPLDLHRWSARQQQELSLRGVAGELRLPAGPGPLWPLLAAALWLHLGKGTIVGLGQPVVLGLE